MEEYEGWISKSQTLIVVSTLPLTNLLPSKCKHLTSPECPVKVITDHLLLVLIFHTYNFTKFSKNNNSRMFNYTKFLISTYILHTLIVLSWLPLTILAQSNWIQEIAAEIAYNFNIFYKKIIILFQNTIFIVHTWMPFKCSYMTLPIKPGFL